MKKTQQKKEQEEQQEKQEQQQQQELGHTLPVAGTNQHHRRVLP